MDSTGSTVKPDLLRNIPERYPLPEPLSAIIDATADMPVDQDQVTGLVEDAPDVRAAMLALAMTRLVGTGGPVDGIDEIFTRLGARTVRMLALVIAHHRTFAHLTDCAATHFRRHGAVVAGLTGILGERYSPATSQMASLHGLLHDAGRMVLHDSDPAGYAKVVERCQSRMSTDAAAERAIFGTDHQAAGRALARAWGLLDQESHAMADHHAPEIDEAEAGVGFLHGHRLIHLADYVAGVVGETALPGLTPPATDLGSWYVLGVDLPDAVAIAADLPGQIDASPAGFDPPLWPSFDPTGDTPARAQRMSHRLRARMDCLNRFRNRLAVLQYGRDLEQSLEYVLEEALEPLGMGRVLIYVPAQGAEVLLPWRTLGEGAPDPAALPALPLHADSEAVAVAVRRGTALPLGHAAEGWSHSSQALEALGASSAVVAPIRGDTEVYAVMLADLGEYAPAVFDVRVLARMGREAGTFLDHAEATADLGRRVRQGEAPVHDDATGIYSTTFLMERLDQEVARSRRTGIPFSVLLLKIRDFERVSNLPADMGAELLGRIVEAIRVSVRAADSAFRCDEDGFAVILPETPGAAALRPTQLVLDAVNRLDLSDLLPDGGVDVRWAVAAHPDDGSAARDLLAKAEERLRPATERPDG
ncbi:MAG: HDOD domain-containing protein [Armatimonadia bacterium]|nr:HDOD domain-containing protein [Armatimonadia bacterium]